MDDLLFDAIGEADEAIARVRAHSTAQNPREVRLFEN
jgi:hypothetical protein